MVQDGVEWFGDTLTRQVMWALARTSWNAHHHLADSRMVLGSTGRHHVSGRPVRRLRVHIGSGRCPTSNDGWDSGTVSLTPGLDPISAMSGVLNTQTYYYVFGRLHNQRLGAVERAGDVFYTAGQLVNEHTSSRAGRSQRYQSICYNPDMNQYLLCSSMGKWPTGRESATTFLNGNGEKIARSLHRR